MVRTPTQPLTHKLMYSFQKRYDAVIDFTSTHQTALVVAVALITPLLLSDMSWAVTVENLREPVQALKKEIFGGWMYVAKIAAGSVGVIASIFMQNLKPIGIGGAICAGIHFMDSWLGDGSAALI